MDPIAYCAARNVVCFPAWYTRTELKSLLNRGARSGKGFNFSERSPSGWEAYLKAVSADYSGELIGMMGTGGLSIKLVKEGEFTPEMGKDARYVLLDEKQRRQCDAGVLTTFVYQGNLYADTVVPCLKTMNFVAAGSSDLAKGTPEVLEIKAPVYAWRVLHQDAA